ncbi:TIR domain-containing protein [Butyrivibrio sp. INlla21]|uniref:TIR domain-containing protein n=1 Tax=Butyrivibrio sp. INlla21 TaxID=1520811 RepID=UPI0008F2721E|nr:TIR domain-containing protein [Butyrivibrio sp. INlla21]SFV03880.1 MTH538 TIR-like domain [Butyrivibrio sp. INlla21]
MARSVFYSFHYENDIFRVNQVRNRWVTYGNQIQSGIIDHAEFEKIKRTGKKAVENWIDSQLDGTSATIVLIGAETLYREYVQYEICKSLHKNNAIIGVYINNLSDIKGMVCSPCNRHTVIGYYSSGKPAYFDEVADAIYDYRIDNGYENLDKWVERAIIIKNARL